jgi:hypothetical protein
MGFYDNGTVYGIKMYSVEGIIFEKICDELMSNEEKKKAYLFYTEINDKDGISFKYYTECSSTYGEEIFLMWFPISLEFFLEKFGV